MVEGEFIEGDMAAFASEGVGIGGETIDAAAVDEFKGEGGNGGVSIEDNVAQVFGNAMAEVGPVEAILELEAGLLEITGDDIGVVASAGSADL